MERSSEKQSKGSDKAAKELFRTVLDLKDPSECEAFFSDLCTPQELRALADRWKVAKLLAKGVSYRDIYEKTGVSTATVTRVARCMSLGAGGYRVSLQRQGILNGEKNQ